MPQDSKASGRDHIPDFQNTAPSGVNWLLVIAIDEYINGFTPLHNAVRDAQTFRDTLHKQYSFEVTNTRELYNEEATRDAILEVFDELTNKINTSPTSINLIFYFSGHGELINGRGYWLPIDAQKNRRGTYLPNEEVTHFIKGLIKAHHVLGIVDACFAGTLFPERNASDTWQRFYNIPSRCIMTAGRNEVVSDGIPGFNSPFAKSLLTQLEANTSNVLSATMLWERMKEGVVANSKQTPRYEPVQDVGHLGGEFYFHLKRDEVRDWEVAQQQNTILAYTNFRRNHPKGMYYQEAKQKIRDLEEEEDWQKALRRNKVSDYEDYLEEHPNGKHVAEAHQNIDAILNRTQVETPVRVQIADSTPSAVSNLQTFGTFTDKRDKQTYKTVELNGLVWMAENLNFDTGEDCWYYKENGIERREYGRLYTWESALKACPSGWRLPEEKEWDDLMKSFGGYIDKSDEMRIRKVGDGILEEAFSEAKAKLNIVDAGGFRNEKGEFHNDHIASYWSAKKLRYGYVLNYDFDNNSKIIYKTKIGKLCALSVRYVRDPKLDAKLILPKEEIITDPPRLPFEPEMVFVQGGTFKMGSNDDDSEKPIHEVTLRDFYIGKYPVTFAEYDAFCEATNKEKPNDKGWGRDRRPVINVSWHDTQEYCKWLSKQTGKNYRLPTEAEWEYAARGGNQSKGFKYAGSDNLNEVGWNCDWSIKLFWGKTQPVRGKMYNELGIYDMSGNVWEWCADVWHKDYEGAPTDGNAWVSSGDQSKRVIRGGGWNNAFASCRVSNRSFGLDKNWFIIIGFRLAGY